MSPEILPRGLFLERQGNFLGPDSNNNYSNQNLKNKSADPT